MNPANTVVATTYSASRDLDPFVGPFEEFLNLNEEASLRAFLPEPAHPLFALVMCELIRVDLEFAWRRGRKKRLEEYLATCPEVFADPKGLEQIAFEEYRLRREAGENPSPDEYRNRFHIESGGWQELAVLKSSKEPGRSVERRSLKESEEIGSSRLLLWLEKSDPQAAYRLAKGLTSMPEVGSSYLGFQLVGELGRGAFARVFLARQQDLANRYVALKIAADIRGESQTLAHLQHTNIMPIYSAHRSGPFQAVCMPYFGATTLRDLLCHIRSQDALPESGQVFITTLNNRRASTCGQGSESVLREAWGVEREDREASGNASRLTPHASHLAPDSWPPIPRNEGPATLRELQSMSYADSVLWMASRLAEGLAHAHDRGIYHRDLKPANILVTDEGQPMLLDFNLAAQCHSPAEAMTASVGGTLPYMSPEHLEAFTGKKRIVDGRSDIYSLGLILYELLAGKYPYRSWTNPTDESLPGMIEDRLRPPPSLRAYNAAVSPAVEALVRHCLEPDPKRRYQRAQDLHEDLQRQLSSLPLKHASEPSWRERGRKFVRRHPRLTSSTSVAAFAALLLLALGTGFVVRGERVARQEARENLGAFEEDLRSAQLLLCARNAVGDELAQGARLCRAALGRYGVLEDPSWKARKEVLRLDPQSRETLHAEVGEALLLLADATARQASLQLEPGKRRQSMLAALEVNDLAEKRLDGEGSSQALWRQRAEVNRLLGREAEATRAREQAQAIPLRTTRDLYLTAHEYFENGQPGQAIPLLQEATRRDPQNFPAWAVLGNCSGDVARDDEAVACYTACIALRPAFYKSWYNRGLIYLRQRHYDLSLADFTRAIELEPQLADSYINRALAHEGLEDYSAAIKDLDQALELGTPRTRVYFMRAYVRERSGDREGARRDSEEGLKLTPSDEPSWIARGLARLESDPRGALADFDRALQLQPRSVEALENKANVLGERLGRTDDAIQALDQAIAIAPEYVPARAGRGVLRARQGKYAAALRDAQDSLLRDTKPPNLYQVAGIYALCSRENPGHALQAFQLLSSALRTGFGLDLVDIDHDLDPIRNRPEFKTLVSEARLYFQQVTAGSK